MMIRLLLLISVCFFTNVGMAQKMSWKKHLKKAEEKQKAGDLESAATHYWNAWQKKDSKPELAFQAGMCYLQLRDYRKAAECFAPIKPGKDQTALAGFHYARALKQDGQHASAKGAFEQFITAYSGADKNQVAERVETEIAGCNLMASLPTDSPIELELLGSGINTAEAEFAPLPFSDDILYFSSTVDGYAKIYRSHLQNGSWSAAVLPKFPHYKDLHVAHGTFSPDNKRFYFTICDAKPFQGATAACDIYVTVREDDNWSTPRKLRDYVKLEGTTATHPYVVHDGDTEILYFASDRKGGLGGMDIWWMTRHVESQEYDFTLPQNAGPAINTPQNEITPYFDLQEKVLYFSSDGHASLGGFDIFKAKGEKQQWSTPSNLGLPFNSFVDDYYFRPTPSGNGGFLSSNRLFGLEKITTAQDDIFYYSTPKQEVLVSGNLYDKTNNSILNDVQISLYEVKFNGQKRLLQSIIANSGTYQFALLPERKFRIEANKMGFETASYQFDTYNFNPEQAYGKAIYLEPNQAVSSVRTTPVLREEDSTASIEEVVENPSAPITVVQPVTYVNSLFQGNEVTTTAPKVQGTYYKVQISTATQYDEQDSQFNSVRHLGRMDTEYIAAKNWTRVLLADFYSLREAKTIMERARASGFPEAFVVKYRNGKRLL